MALEMSWQPSLLHQKRKTAAPLGLRNLGNTCYLNSVLQCLTYTPPLANFCLRHLHSSLCNSTSEGDRKRDCAFCILERRIVRSLSVDQTLDSPTKIQSCIRLFAEHFRYGRQEDAHEFLRYVIDACHNTCLRLKKLQRRKAQTLNGNTIVKDIFGGALQSQVKCLSCGAESNKIDEIMDISLEVLHSNSLKEAMQKFFQPEVLDGNNKYKCEKCEKLVAARKQMSILQAPNVFVIQLKRFEGIYGAKIDKAIAFEEPLVLSSHMCKGSQDPHPEYSLFGTIVHSGYSPESGHYYAYIKDALGRWYCCNDSCVSLSTLTEVLSEKVYVLFFSRTSQRPLPSTTGLASNGIKSNGGTNGIHNSKIQKPNLPPKPVVSTKPLAGHTSPNEPLSISKVDKVRSTPPMKFRLQRDPATINGKIDGNKVHSMDKAEDGKDSILHSNKSENGGVPLLKENCADNNRQVDAVNGTPNGEVHSNGFRSAGADKREVNGASRQVKAESGTEHSEVPNVVAHSHTALSGSKRKPQDCSDSLSFAQDSDSRAELEEYKEVLKKEASSILRSCGWLDNVYSSMHSKKMCAREAGDTSTNRDDLKKKLISEAKSTFLSQIPESLKETLIERLRTFSQEKLQVSAPDNT